MFMAGFATGWMICCVVAAVAVATLTVEDYPCEDDL